MKITLDPAKRNATLDARGLDVREAALVFEGPVPKSEDTRQDYGERRMGTIGYLGDRMVFTGWTQRGEARHVFRMRKCNAREQKDLDNEVLRKSAKLKRA